MEFFTFDEDAVTREQEEGYEVISQPGRSIVIVHHNGGTVAGRVEVHAGCAGLLTDMLLRARDVQMGDDDA